MEVLEAKRTNWRTRSVFLVLTSVAVTATIVVVALLVFGSSVSHSSVVGQPVPSKGPATVLAPATGLVSRTGASAREHIAVRPTLAVVTAPHAPSDGGDTLVALVKQLQCSHADLESERAEQLQFLSGQEDGLLHSGPHPKAKCRKWKWRPPLVGTKCASPTNFSDACVNWRTVGMSASSKSSIRNPSPSRRLMRCKPCSVRQSAPIA